LRELLYSRQRGEFMAIAKYRFRRRSSPALGKLQTALARARARKRGPEPIVRDLTAMSGGTALGLLERRGIVPERIMGLDSAFVIGGLGAFVIGRAASGTFGRVVHDMSLGALCVSGYRLGQGQKLLAGDEESQEYDSDDSLEGGGWVEGI
jgi:hypothetical protein